MKIISEDDHTPDALEYFDKKMIKHTGLSVDAFKEAAVKVDFDMGYEWRYGKFVLTWFADNPFYELSEEAEPESLIDKLEFILDSLEPPHADAMFITPIEDAIKILSKECLWSDQTNFDMEGTYDTSCGEMWAFTQNGLKENGITYCPFCGGRIIEEVK